MSKRLALHPAGVTWRLIVKSGPPPHPGKAPHLQTKGYFANFSLPFSPDDSREIPNHQPSGDSGRDGNSGARLRGQ